MHHSRIIGIEADGTKSDQANRPRQQLVLGLVQPLEHLLWPVECGKAGTGSWRMIGPESTPSSTKWTVTPPTLTP